MDLTTAIGLISSLITIEEGGRGLIKYIIRIFNKDEKILYSFDSDDSTIQSALDKIKSQMKSNYMEYIFTDSDIDGIIKGFFERNHLISINYEDKKT